jgi:cytochrome c556
MRIRQRIVGALLAGAMLMITGGFVAAAPTPAEIIKTRQDSLKAMGGAMKAIGDQLKSGMPDMAVVSENAKKIDGYATDLPTWFPKGSGEEAGVKTAAKAEIWTMPDDFKTDAAAGDASAIGPQMQATGKACGACHKEFRVPPPEH